MTLAERVRAGESVVGTMLRVSRHPAVMTLARDAGLDFVMLDLEHGGYSIETVEDLACAARGAGVAVLVRVPELARGYVSRVLDCGAEGVMVPMIDTPAQARQFVQWAKYPPLGGRGLAGTSGHTRYQGLPDAARFMEEANRQTLTIAQIETVQAVENAAAIAGVDGVDALLIGPSDLSVSLGKPGQFDCPEERAAIARVAAVARQAGKALGMHAGPDMLKQWTGQGLRLLMNSMDTALLAKGFAAVNAETRSLVTGLKST